MKTSFKYFKLFTFAFLLSTFAFSCDGQIPSIGGMQKPGISESTDAYDGYIIVSSQINTYSSSDGGNTWETISDLSGLNLYDIEVSESLQYQLGCDYYGYTYVSSDYGVSWTEITSIGSQAFYAVGMSSSGQYQLSTGRNEYIYVSSDYGANWVSRSNSSGHYGADINSTGQYQATAPSTNYIRYSDDYGASFSTRSDLNYAAWRNIAFNQTGELLVAVSDTYGDSIYISNDYGATMVAVTPAAIGTVAGLDISSSGQYITCATAGSMIYVSSDYGVNWAEVNATETYGVSSNFRAVYMSNSGQYQAICGTIGNILISSDYGTTWSIITSPEASATLCSIAISKL